MAYRKKYKALILKYVPCILKYMACIFYNMPYVFSGMRSASKNVALFCFLVRRSTVVLQI